MNDLKSDSAPLPTTEPRKAPVPRVVNISNSSGVHIGPIVQNMAFPPRRRPQAPHNPEDMPRKKEVEELLKCSREMTDEDKMVVSEHLGGAWKTLGRAMGLSPGQLDNVSEDHRRATDRTYEVLTRWHDREADDATVAVLAGLVLKVKAYHVLKYLKP